MRGLKLRWIIFGLIVFISFSCTTRRESVRTWNKELLIQKYGQTLESIENKYCTPDPKTDKKLLLTFTRENTLLKERGREAFHNHRTIRNTSIKPIAVKAFNAFKKVDKHSDLILWAKDQQLVYDHQSGVIDRLNRFLLNNSSIAVNQSIDQSELTDPQKKELLDIDRDFKRLHHSQLKLHRDLAVLGSTETELLKKIKDVSADTELLSENIAADPLNLTAIKSSIKALQGSNRELKGEVQKVVSDHQIDLEIQAAEYDRHTIQANLWVVVKDASPDSANVYQTRTVASNVLSILKLSSQTSNSILGGLANQDRAVKDFEQMKSGFCGVTKDLMKDPNLHHFNRKVVIEAGGSDKAIEVFADTDRLVSDLQALEPALQAKLTQVTSDHTKYAALLKKTNDRLKVIEEELTITTEMLPGLINKGDGDKVKEARDKIKSHNEEKKTLNETLENKEVGVQLMSYVNDLESQKTELTGTLESKDFFKSDVSELVYLLGAYLQYYDEIEITEKICNMTFDIDNKPVTNNLSFLKTEKYLNLAARIGSPDALFELAVHNSFSAGSIESHNTAINLFYQAGMKYVDLRDFNKASLAVEGILSLDSDSPLAKSLNAKINSQAGLSDLIPAVTPKSYIYMGRESKTEDPSSDQKQDGASEVDLENGYQNVAPIMSAINDREMAKSVVVNFASTDLQFSDWNSGNSLEERTVDLLDSHRIETITFGFDYLKNLSFLITAPLHMDPTDLKVDETTVHLRGLTNDATDDVGVSNIKLEFLLFSYHYYPQEYFYLGYSYLMGKLHYKQKSTSYEENSSFGFNDHRLVLGFNYEVSDPVYTKGQNPLIINKNTLSVTIHGMVSYPIYGDSPISIINSIGVGLRF